MAAVRPAGPADAPAVAEIYNEGIETRLATFETEPRSASDIQQWLAAGERLPLLVAEQDGRVLGWARIIAYSDRPAYAGVGEVSVFVPSRRADRGWVAPCSKPCRTAREDSATGSSSASCSPPMPRAPR